MVVATAQPRSGKELVRATLPYARETRWRTWYEFIVSVVLFAGAEAVALLAPWWLAPVGTVLAALLLVRLFIIYHDAVHGAIFRGDKLGQFLISIVGVITLSPWSVWRETHDYHHQNNCKLPGTAIGSYPVVTTRMWRRMKPAEKRTYAAIRHPLNMMFGYFTIFLAGMCASSFWRNPRLHYMSAVAPIVHFGFVGLAWYYLGLGSALMGVVVPLFIACAVGSYLFYAQHNFPGVYFSPRTAWDYYDAALKSSSYFKMSPVMHFFTGNIGYHHIHHLNHKVPFYELPRVMANIPELQQVGETSWAPRDVFGALRLKLWDPAKKEMVPFPS